MISKARGWARLTALLVVAALATAACGDDGGSAGGEPAGANDSSTGSTASSTTATPKAGGTLSFGVWSETNSLDPIVSTGDGVTGGIEMAAIYDTVMRWNPTTTQYEPRTAQSLTPDATFSTWTLKLRSGLTFPDGTAYDAEAVRFNIARHKSAENRTSSAAYVANISEMKVVDATTLVFTLNAPWAGFPFVLADEGGMIVNPTVIKALGDPAAADYKAKKDAFNLNPGPAAGIGPFELVSFKPKEAITMRKKASYWGGAVYLDGLRFVPVGGGQQTYDALSTGTLDAAFLFDPVIVAKAKAAGVGGYTSVRQLGSILLMNAGVAVTCAGGKPEALCAGKADGTKVPTTPATRDVKVRQAIAAAVDNNVINQRVYGGQGLATNAMFHSTFPFDPKVPGPKYDPEQAKKLVTEAKAAGWNGKLNLSCTNSQTHRDLVLALTTMLAAVGIEVLAKTDQDTSGQVNDVIVNKNFEAACWGFQVTEDDSQYTALLQGLTSTSPTNRTGYANPKMDDAVAALRKASTKDEKTAAFKTIAEIYAQDVPVLNFGATPQYVAWSKKVNGIVPNASAVVYFDKAWIAS